MSVELDASRSLRSLLARLEEQGAQADFADVQAAASTLDPAEAAAREEDLIRLRRLRDRLARLEQRERELSALYDTARDFTGLRDVEHVLQAIVRRARQLMRTDIAYLSAYDAERDDFYVRATVGTISESFQRIRVAKETGICGHVAREKCPYFSSDYLHDGRFLHNSGIDAGVGEEEVVSILGVPLLVEEQVIGVLFVADRYQRAYATPQIALLSSLAAHAAVAIESARLFEANEIALARERETNARLQRQTAEIEAAASVHDQLAALIARGGDLQDLADVVAREMAGSVVVFAPDARTVHAAAGAGARDRLESLGDRARAALEESHAGGRAVAVDGEAGVHVAAAVGGGVVQGGILLATDEPLSATRVRTLERSAVIAALVLLSQERVRAAEQRAIGDLVTALVRGQGADPAGLASDAARRGVDFGAGATVMAVDAPGLSAPVATDIVRNVLTPKGIAAEVDGRLVVLASGPSPRDLAGEVRRLFAARCAEPVTVAYASAVTAPDAVPAAADAARRSLSVLLQLGRRGGVEDADGLGPYALLFGDRERGALGAYVRQSVQPLLDHDRDRGTDLAATLLTYLDLGRDVRAASETLHVHPNTLRQRLRTIGRVLPRWDDPAHRLDVHLALRLAALTR